MRHLRDRADGARLLAALCCAALLLPACATTPQAPAAGAATGATAQPAAAQATAPAAPTTPAAQPAQAPAQGAETPAPAPATGGPQRPKGFDFPSEPADGKWLTDDQGRRYFVHELAKIPGTFNRPDPTRIKFWYTPPFELVRETDESFFVKMYSPEAPVEAGATAKPSIESLEQVEASYKAAIAPSDRLRFVAWSKGLPTRGQWRQGFDVSDVNGDGHPDIVHGPPRKGGSAPAIFLGDGKGNWRRWTAVALPPVPLDYGDAAAADFNGDGALDLAFASHLRGVSVFVGDGKGGFKPWSQGIEFKGPGEDDGIPAFSSRKIQTVDWNGDGKLDILAVGEGPNLTTPRVSGGSRAYGQGSRGAVIYLNQGDGTWSKLPGTGGGTFGDAVATGDFNGDGKLDFVTASASQGNKAVLNLGQADGTWKVAAIDVLRPGATFRGVDAADFNGDGREDLAVGYGSLELGVWRTGVDVLTARADGGWERLTLWVELGSDGIWGLGAGDVDGDKAADVVALTGGGATLVFLGNGKGGFTREEGPELTLADVTGCKGYHVELADLDGDGVAEVAASFAGEGGDFLGSEKCPSGGSLRVWKAEKQGAR
jgi:hypothetical protein